MAFQSMRLTMSRWIRGREAMRPFLWMARRWAGDGNGSVSIAVGAGDACTVQSAVSDAGVMQNADGGVPVEAEDGPTFARVAACAPESVISDGFSVSWFMFVLI